MANPILGTELFGGDQKVSWSITTYNTPYSIASKGIIHRPSTPTSSFGSGITFSTATLTAMHTHFDANTTPGLVDASGTEVTGRVPLIYDYWGAQAPLGVYRPQAAILRYKGYVKTTGDYGLSVHGRGAIKVFKNGTAILNGPFTEDTPRATNGLVSFTAGDQIDIFYWGISVAWGGIAFRVFTDASAVVANVIDWDLLRESDILSASWMDSGETVTSVSISEVVSASTIQKRGEVATCQVTVSTSAVDNEFGWYIDHTTSSLVDSFTGNSIRPGHLIVLAGGTTGDINTVFTGNITDIIPNGENITLQCSAIAHKLASQLSENYPDRLSYATFGYTDRQGVANPAWNVPAFDHWPYEYAIKDLLARSWIDSSRARGIRSVKRVGQTTAQNGTPLFRCRDLSDNLIRIQRQANYGNPEGNPELVPDDDYLTTSELSDTLYARIQSLVGRIGYQFYSNASGNILLGPTNNPTSVEAITGGTTTVDPSSIGGTYEEFIGTSWSVAITDVLASRLELVVGRGASLGTVTVTVTCQEDSSVTTTVIDTSYAEDIAYYDQLLTADLANITSFTILSGAEYGTYDIAITPLGGSVSTEYRLDTIRVFEQDPIIPAPAFNISTFYNALSLSGRSTYTDHVNDAVVTGVRKSSLTDSSKASDKVQYEYVISRSTDIHAILNPDAVNFDGRKITAFLSNESIGDQDLANWASRTLVSRYRNPAPDLSVQHTILPVLELNDPIRVTDGKFDSFDATVTTWVTSITHNFSSANATTQIELTSFSEVPSFEPREEIDISLFNNKPIINLDISYPSLDGSSTISNPIDQLAQTSTRIINSGVLTWPGVPFVTLQLTVADDTMSPGTDLFHSPRTAAVVNKSLVLDASIQHFKNNPYYQFYSTAGTTLTVAPLAADGSVAYSNPTNWQLAAGDYAEYSYHKIQDVYSGVPPFYDPYYSELSSPELVTIGFDALVSGYYRVSLIDARSKDGERVAWLTNPTQSDVAEEKHWQYITAGPSKQFFWDGVDNIGLWNTTQTEEYGWRQRGSFDNNDNPVIGKGFYCANDQSSGMTHISAEMDGSDVVYPIGNYAQFYVLVEVLRDTDAVPLTVASNIAADVLDTSATALTERYVYYHLPQPNKTTIAITDWDDSTGEYTAGGTDWTTMNADATFRDGKPVKITPTPLARLGAKFASDNSLTHVKLSRVAHLSAQVYDETAVMHGTRWNSLSSAEQRTILSRRRTNDDHTLIFQDNDFLPGDEVSPWVFYPDLFETDFSTGKDSIQYLDYLQLQEVPYWNPQRKDGEERSRMLLGLMGYVFYMSVYSQDRSGRLVWAIDTTFVDKSKILTNTTPTEFPSDLERHQRRTVFARQWWDFDALETALGTTYSVPEQYYGAYSDAYDFHYEASDYLYPSGVAGYVSGTTKTSYTDPYTEAIHDVSKMVFLPPTTATALDRDLGDSGNTALGDWTWETDGLSWIPNITRDFHPYYKVPPMALASYQFEASAGWTPWWESEYWYAITESPAGVVADEAKFDSYFAIAHEYDTGNFTEYLLQGGRQMTDIFQKDDGSAKAVPNTVIQIQRQDDIKHFEHSRGGFSNGPRDSRDLISITGGDPYLINTKLYRYFRMEYSNVKKDGSGNRRTIWYNDVWRKGFFFQTFRHTYNWESPSLFPIDFYKALMPGGIDFDKTGSPVRPVSYDIGAWAGWKDDHPSAMQEGVWHETGTCSDIHWRNDHTNLFIPTNIERQAHAGGSCEIDDPDVKLTDEDFKENIDYLPGNNIFLQKYWFSYLRKLNVSSMAPIAVGPRLPQTRRVLLALVLLNKRRSTPL